LTTIHSLGLAADRLRVVAGKGETEPTPARKPAVRLAAVQTGTGKTAVARLRRAPGTTPADHHPATTEARRGAR
jgi:hypothetical protein